MPIPLVIGLYAAAGALAGAGVGGASILVRRARQEGALDTASQDNENLRALLRQEIDLAELKAQAEELGVDVEAVIRGYERLKSDAPSLEGLIVAFENHGLEVPSKQPELAARSMSSPETQAVTPAEMRQWAKDNGLDVADRGPIPQHVKDAYRDAH